MRKTLDVYEDRTKPSFRVRLADGYSLAKADLASDWLVVPTEDEGEVAVDLRRATKLHVRERTEHDDRSYEDKLRASIDGDGKDTD